MSTEHKEQKRPPGWSIALTAYLFPVGCLIAMSMNADAKSAYGRFHLRQAFFFHLLLLGTGTFLYFIENNYDLDVSSARSILWLVYFGFLLFGLQDVFRNKRTILPLLGERPQSWFTFIP